MAEPIGSNESEEHHAANILIDWVLDNKDEFPGDCLARALDELNGIRSAIDSAEDGG